MADLIGQQLGNYHLTSLLGSGGFAEVYLGEHVRLGMQAAIKVLHAHLVGEEAEAFQAEARVISELINPHIIRVLDFDIEHGTPFLVLDYAPQGSLGQRHKRGTQVPLEAVITYVNQVADALQYAHDQKHIHRDVKPANMLVGRQGEILLSDFGISSVSHSTSSIRTEAPLGTLAYMAPEQIQGRARAASDQYSLAVTVYQWLTGALPFHGSSMEIIGQQLGATPAPLRSLVPAISPVAEQVVLTALAKDPHTRFQSIKTFASELSQASQEQESQTTFSYTATTVVEPRQKTPLKAMQPPFQPDLREVVQRPVAVPDLALSTTLPDAQTPRSASAPTQAQVHTTERVQPTPYLQPAAPYVPLAEQALPRIGWTGFLQGSILGICIFLIEFFGSLPLLYLAAIFVLLSFAGAWWTTQRTGLLRSGVFAALWTFLLSIIGFVGYYRSAETNASFSISALIATILIAILCNLLGGLIGRSIHRSRQPIHPPAGGSISR